MNKKIGLTFVAILLLTACVSASTVSRSFSSTEIEPGQSITVTLTADITGGETYYAIDETLPSGWTISNPGTGNNDEAGHLKWVMIESAVDTAYTYTLTASGSGETTSFSGLYMFEGMKSEASVSGQSQVIVSEPAECTQDSDCTGQICCGQSCVDLVCSIDIDCDDSDSSTTDNCSNPGTCSAACPNTKITECINDDNYCPPDCNSETDNDCIESCGNEVVDAGETCSNCPEDITCKTGTICCSDECFTPCCYSDSNCYDGDACTTDYCNNRGTCTASCSNSTIVGCRNSAPNPGTGTSSGATGNRLTASIEGSCLNQPITATILNQEGNPATGSFVRVTKNGITVETRTTPETGKNSFTFETEGEYTFYTTKSGYYAGTQKIHITQCQPPTINFKQKIETGQNQTITLTAGDGNTITDFNLYLTYPNNTTALLKAQEGTIILPTEETGTYTATLQTTGYQTTISYQATNPLQIIPNINPDAKPTVETVFGEETVEQPNYLIIWILAIAIISGLIIEVTKLKPGWFRVFMAVTYTALPLAVNYYSKNTLIAFITIIIQTLILTALYFNQWRIKKALQAISKLENN